MKLSIQEKLEDKGITVKEGHLPLLQTRWDAIQDLKKKIDSANLDDADISLRNTPGGDHIE
ncbi:hypothetical protein J6TS1_26140 [Siminovitchia terrae]|uniref:Uncharacterized protein n=1 Tax=Siminovitchia terrae TaxID=1914933 RepID=A0A429X4W3_SIMTE|nr:hypothetical protein [Siminovitchia terrae]RST58446.1 hypothetical protein D5F11_017535 [Siminovitchia terrae]GIN93983.1 hypothetical protein J22TS1_50340 [Siminovitchia terrae]GIN96744.1 hypothetical protein J6TS1_26140 [Siminovitchia terrae]